MPPPPGARRRAVASWARAHARQARVFSRERTRSRAVARTRAWAACSHTVNVLTQAGVRAKADTRENYTPGWRFNHWELKGVPVRLELGPRDLEAGTVIACRRDTLEKVSLPLPTIVDAVKGLLDSIHASMLAAATKERDEHTKVGGRLADGRGPRAWPDRAPRRPPAAGRRARR